MTNEPEQIKHLMIRALTLFPVMEFFRGYWTTAFNWHSFLLVHPTLSAVLHEYLSRFYPIEYSIDGRGRLETRYEFRFYHGCPLAAWIGTHTPIRSINSSAGALMPDLDYLNVTGHIRCHQAGRTRMDLLIGCQQTGSPHYCQKTSTLRGVFYPLNSQPCLIDDLDDPVPSEYLNQFLSDLPADDRFMQEDILRLANGFSDDQLTKMRQRYLTPSKKTTMKVVHWLTRMFICDCALQWGCTQSWIHMDCDCLCHDRCAPLYWWSSEELYDLFYRRWLVHPLIGSWDDEHRIKKKRAEKTLSKLGRGLSSTTGGLYQLPDRQWEISKNKICKK